MGKEPLRLNFQKFFDRALLWCRSRPLISIFLTTLFLITGPAIMMAIAAAQSEDSNPGYNFSDVFFAFITLSFLILVGRWIRQHVGILQSLYVPSSVVVGVVALLLGPGVLGATVSATA